MRNINTVASVSSGDRKSNSMPGSDWNFKHVSYPVIAHVQTRNKELLKKTERWSAFKIMRSCNRLIRTIHWRQDNPESEAGSNHFQKARYPKIGINKFKYQI